MKPAFIFDMDGTLFQTDRILEIALEDAFSHLRSKGLWGSATPIGQYRNIMGAPLPKVWETLLPGHSAAVREEANDYFHERLIWNIENGNGALYPNVGELLAYLKNQGYPLFIASNGLAVYLKAIVDHYRLDRWITETFSIEQIPSLNKGELVKLITEEHAIGCGAVVGDRLSDIQAAKTNNLLAIGCRFDFAQESELVQADFVIEDLQEIQALLPMVNQMHLHL